MYEWENRPESVKGEGAAIEIVRVIHKIAQVEERLLNIENEIAQMKESEIYELKTKVEEAENERRDLLAEMASQLHEKIVVARERLDKII
ncbi:MAG: hypothetical protein ACE5HI_18800 [bacterium]